ncbi:hypothetical protein [Aestuariispira insulae]|uniref:Uncharacterized protein n=1 Tax=Aestuariispira insulae TaxID=1461337 RepID=A0A3D9HEY8_9PROT|nr:hypothetical protein [Aestuariispira insulae]RED48033.1 hypothetical protein DFP90_10850 [Aestuariispira insulae]
MSEAIVVDLNDGLTETVVEGVYGARLGRRLGRLWLDFYVDRCDPNTGKKRRVVVSRLAMDPSAVVQLAQTLVEMDLVIRKDQADESQDSGKRMN